MLHLLARKLLSWQALEDSPKKRGPPGEKHLPIVQLAFSGHSPRSPCQSDRRPSMGTSQKMVLDRAQSALAMLGGISAKAIVTLVVCVGLGTVGIYYATTINSDVPLSDSGSFALIIGVTFTLILGVGLMALIFFSSRNGFDEPPDVQSDGERKR
jgi:hypothetical protein